MHSKILNIKYSVIKKNSSTLFQGQNIFKSKKIFKINTARKKTIYLKTNNIKLGYNVNLEKKTISPTFERGS